MIFVKGRRKCFRIFSLQNCLCFRSVNSYGYMTFIRTLPTVMIEFLVSPRNAILLVLTSKSYTLIAHRRTWKLFCWFTPVRYLSIIFFRLSIPLNYFFVIMVTGQVVACHSYPWILFTLCAFYTKCVRNRKKLWILHSTNILETRMPPHQLFICIGAMKIYEKRENITTWCRVVLHICVLYSEMQWNKNKLKWPENVPRLRW